VGYFLHCPPTDEAPGYHAHPAHPVHRTASALCPWYFLLRLDAKHFASGGVGYGPDAVGSLGVADSVMHGV
jgi:hypothetical protein